MEQRVPQSEQLASGFITVNNDWIVTSCNAKGSLILSRDQGTMRGMDCRTLFCMDQRFREFGLHLTGFSHPPDNPFKLTLSDTENAEKPAVVLRFIPIPDTDSTILGAVIGFADLNEPMAASRMALNSITEGVFTVNRDWCITSFNSAAERITGWKEEEVIGQQCKDVFQADICSSNCAISDCIHEKSDISARMAHIRTSDGRVKPVRLNAAPLMDTRGQIIGGVETFVNISDTLRYELILDAIADGVISVDINGYVRALNKSAETITGYSATELTGENVCLLFPPEGEEDTSCLEECKNSGRSLLDQDMFLIGKNGYSIPVNVSIAPYTTEKGDVFGFVYSFKDNTNQLQKALILDSVADGVFTVNRDWKITSFNLSAELITGWNREDAIGSFCSDVFKSSICGRNCAIAESLYTGTPVANKSITIKNIDGKKTAISISAAPLIDHEGNVMGGVETFRDLSVEMQLRQQLTTRYSFESIVSKAPAMRRIFQILPDIARSESNVLILGESGTGKELIAGAIFNASERRDKPFVVVNCGALPDTLLESELFGYRAGAFTDAKKDKIGRFAAAEGGTIFLDEIGDIPQSLQVKLLRVLQQKQYEPLGSNTSVTADVRIIAATNRELPRLVSEGSFRDDLYYRLNVVNIALPPLRKRREDIPLLVEHFVNRFRAEKQKDIAGGSDTVISMFMRYDFPGNIRELENIIEYAFILCPGGYILPEHLPEPFSSSQSNPHLASEEVTRLEDLERIAITNALTRNHWKKMVTCRELGISKDTLRRKIAKFNIEPPELY